MELKKDAGALEYKDFMKFCTDQEKEEMKRGIEEKTRKSFEFLKTLTSESIEGAIGQLKRKEELKKRKEELEKRPRCRSCGRRGVFTCVDGCCASCSPSDNEG